MPSASSVAVTAGPILSICLSSCLTTNPETITANRRGVANRRAEEKERRSFFRPALMPLSNAFDSEPSALGGNSSVPISIKNSCVSILTIFPRILFEEIH